MDKKIKTGKVVTLSFGHFFHDVYSAFLAPMLPLLITKLSLSLSMVALLDVIRKVPSLFNPFIGLLADKLCVKYLVILTPAVTSISMSLLGVAPSYTVLLILLFVSGLSSTLFHVPAPVMVKNFSGRKTGTGMSYFMFGGEMARSVGPLVITAALALWGLEGSFRVMPLGIIASLILHIKLRDISSLSTKKMGSKPKGARETIRDLSLFFVAIIGFQLFRAGIKSALTLYLPTYLTGNGLSMWIAGISLSVLQLAGAAGTFGSGYITDRIGHRNTLLIAALASPFVMWLFVFANDFFMLPVLVVMGFLLFASGPVILALVQDTNTERPAFINGVYMTINFGISSIMVLVVGILGDTIGLALTYKICAALAFLSVPFVFLLPKRE